MFDIIEALTAYFAWLAVALPAAIAQFFAALGFV